MADKKIEKSRFAEFISAVGSDYAVYGPKANGDVIVFGGIGSAEELRLDYRTSTLSPKELFLPRAETVYQFDGQDFVDEALPDQKRVILGMHPCDCRALTILDKTFDTEQIKDPFYVTRRANTVIVALACDRPLRSCFCTAVGGDPYGEEGADVLLDDQGESLSARSVTEEGEDFLARYGKFFAGKGSGKWAERAEQARGKIRCDLQTDGIKPRLDDLFEDGVWETATWKCLGCGTCSYTCPTCYCFDLKDSKTPTGARKVRTWDCCMFPSFTLHASGHNPRPVNAPRLRQKIMHKFSYYAEQYGTNSCVGCGRCVRNCPVNLDIREVLGELMSVPEGTAKK